MSTEMGVASTKPILTMAPARMEQKAMWMQVRATGYGKPDMESTYLLSRMTAALKKIQRNMQLRGREAPQ
jgi:hypothetical protein